MTNKMKLFIVSSNKSCRDMKEFLEERNIDHETIHMVRDGVSWEDFKDILSKTEDGLDDIISTRSKPYKTLQEEGVNIDDLTLKEVYAIVEKDQRILKAPIVLTDKLVNIGFVVDEVGALLPRSQRRRQIARFLNTEKNRVLPYIPNGNEAKHY